MGVLRKKFLFDSAYSYSISFILVRFRLFLFDFVYFCSILLILVRFHLFLFGDLYPIVPKINSGTTALEP